MHEPIDPREAEVLIQQYVSGELTPEEAARLLAHLKARPSLGETLLGQMEIDLLLRELDWRDEPRSPTDMVRQLCSGASGPSD